MRFEINVDFLKKGIGLDEADRILETFDQIPSATADSNGN